VCFFDLDLGNVATKPAGRPSKSLVSANGSPASHRAVERAVIGEHPRGRVATGHRAAMVSQGATGVDLAESLSGRTIMPEP